MARGGPLHHAQMPLVVDLNMLRIRWIVCREWISGPWGWWQSRTIRPRFRRLRSGKDTLAMVTNLAQQEGLATLVITGLAPSTQLHQKCQEHFKKT